MAKGMALHIGLNSIDPKHYHGDSGELNACEADAEDLYDLALAQGFKPTKLLTKQATKKNVNQKIKSTAKKLASGDFFFLSYSGHGSQLPDLNDDEKDDEEDETWCLFDQQILDDELNLLFSEFKAGVRILVLSDSCHSGSVTKAAFLRTVVDTANSNAGKDGTKYRFLPSIVARNTYLDNRAVYRKILKNPQLAKAEDMIKASVLLISGCQDNQLSEDGTFNGRFTARLLKVWNEGSFRGNYARFHKKICNGMPPDQTPNYFPTGTKDLRFERQTPFTI